MFLTFAAQAGCAFAAEAPVSLRRDVLDIGLLPFPQPTAGGLPACQVEKADLLTQCLAHAPALRRSPLKRSKSMSKTKKKERRSRVLP
jgi:hypothetical protein